MARQPSQRANASVAPGVFRVERRATPPGPVRRGTSMNTTIRRRLAAGAAAAALAVSGAAASSSSSASAAPYCGITWGSSAKATGPGLLWTGRVEGARSARHPCYDRVVFDLGRGAGRLGYSVRYVSAVTSPGSGLPVAVSGGAKIQVTVNAPSTLVRSTTTYAD